MGKVSNYVPLQGNMVMQYGENEFATTGTTVEVPTKLQTLIAAVATPESYTGSAASGGEVLFCDKTVTSGAVTVARRVAVDSGLKFSYVFIGSYGSVGGSGTVTA
jgi:uncharacterized protein with beta-barrel porin domain